MNFILRNWVRYYTKEAFKTLKVVIAGSVIIITVACIKYKPAYKVTLSGETIGFVENKDLIDVKIDKYLADNSGNIAYREIAAKPEYELKLIDRAEELKEKDVIIAVENTVTTTYKTYAITADGEEKAIVDSVETAEKIINEVNSNLDKHVDLKLGISEKFSTELDLNSEEEATEKINEIKEEKVTEYKQVQAQAARLAAAKAAAAKAAAEAAENAQTPSEFSVATTTDVAVTGSLNGMSLSAPVSGSVSSRFGSRGYSRSSMHTGLDIATSAGTGIRPVSSGTVTFAAYNGSYGNLVKVDHGNGVETWYAHCSAIYVSVGQYVDTSSTIAAVGSTGNSTGPHLHLEIRINGSPVNPQNYLY